MKTLRIKATSVPETDFSEPSVTTDTPALRGRFLYVYSGQARVQLFACVTDGVIYVTADWATNYVRRRKLPRNRAIRVSVAAVKAVESFLASLGPLPIGGDS